MENQTNIGDIKVSVIMPVYNAGEYLSRAIKDVLGQTLKDIELILVDDGSNDSSPKIITKFKNRDNRVSTVRQSNAGPSVARNKGFEIAQGKYIMFLDADDMYEPTLLESLYEAAEAHDLDVAVTKFDIYNEVENKYSLPSDEPNGFIFDKGAITSKNEHPDYIFGSTTGYVWNKLIRSSFLRDKKIAFDEDLYVFEDVHFVCSVMALAERVKRIDNVLIHHRVYSDQSRSTLFRKYYGQVPVVYKKIMEFLKHHGMYVPLKKGYLNFSAGRCYKIYNLLWENGKERLWNILHDGYVTELDWIKHEKEAFESMEVYEFIANIALYTYNEYQTKLDRGKNLDVVEMDKEKFDRKVEQKQKISKRRAVWNKIMSFINIFKKKK